MERRIKATAPRVKVASTEPKHKTRDMVVGTANMLHTAITTAKLGLAGPTKAVGDPSRKSQGGRILHRQPDPLAEIE